MNAIILMAIGHKHQIVCNQRFQHYKSYADRCGADLLVCTEPPDPSFYRSLPSQKLLLPMKYRQYEWIAFLDLDILITDSAPSIFDNIDNNYALAAVADPRGAEKFSKCALYYWMRPDIIDETHETYFLNRGFAPHNNNYCSINGGVFLCKPAIVSELLTNFYYSKFQEPAILLSHEEAMLAYATQKHGLFYELDYRFNTIVTYEVYNQPDESLYYTIRSNNFRLLAGNIAYLNSFRSLFPSYFYLIEKLQKNSYFVHFAGNIPLLEINGSKCNE